VSVAYLVFSHRHPEQVLRLLRTLREGSPGAVLLSHHDGPPLEARALRVERVPASPVTWGGASQLLMLLRGLQQALTRDFDWLVVLSGQDYPLRPLAAIERDLARSGVDGFVEGIEVPPPPGDEFSRRYFYRYRRVVEPGRLARRGLRAAAPHLLVRDMPAGVLLGRRVTPPLLPVRRGSDWLSLSRRAVETVAGAPREVIEHFRRTILPTEALPHTVLYASGLPLSGDTRRYTRWDAGAPHPHLLGMDDLDAMLGSGLDFARKFPPGDAVLDELDRVL